MADKPEYYVILTSVGAELEARAVAAGAGIELTRMVVGDASQTYVEPTPDVAALLNEKYSCPIESREISPEDAAVTLLRARIPADAGGFWIREIGVMGRLAGEEEEVLFAYGNHAPYFKMKPQDGQSVIHELCVPVIQSSSCPLTVVVRDDGYATKAELEALRKRIGSDSDAAQLEMAANMVRMSNRIADLEISKAVLLAMASGHTGQQANSL